MSDTNLAQTDPKTLLWQELADSRAGMLGIVGSGQHFQPMAHHADAETNTLWFLTKRSTDLFRAVNPGSVAHFILVAEDQDFHACMSGPLVENMDRTRLDAMWSPITGAWFDGKDDTDLAMLALRLESAAIWASTSSSARFAYEIAKAHVADSDPDVGVHNVIEFV